MDTKLNFPFQTSIPDSLPCLMSLKASSQCVSSGSDFLAQSSCRPSVDVTAQCHLAGARPGRRQPSAVKSITTILGEILGELVEC